MISVDTPPLPPLVSGSRPAIGHLSQVLRDAEQLIRAGYAEHGEVFRVSVLGKPAVFIFGEHTRQFFEDPALDIRSAYGFLGRMLGQDVFFLAEDEEYRRQREIVLNRFQGRHQLGTYVEVMDHEARGLVQQLGEEGEFDILSQFGPLVLRVAARCFLGENFASGLPRDFYSEIKALSGGVHFFLPNSLPLPSVVRSRKARVRLERAITDMIQARRDRPVEPADFLQSLATAEYQDGQPVPVDKLVGLILLLTWSGQDTTAGLMAWAMIDLLRDPAALERVRAEVEQIVADGTLDLAGVGRLDYTSACLRETERLHPVAHIISRRATSDLTVGEFTIPRGALVFASPAVSHRLDGVWEAPHEYRPDRFLGSESRELRQSLIGFGGGIHRCLGQHFATLEMKIVLARLIARFDLELMTRDPRPAAGSMASKAPQGQCLVRYRARR
ncbi:cytochrome P450 [Nocardia noduli]|uniref:cytochrome P450 n=1 Tax=Nocardia noduli TaxID=2815722 RepID=UPI00211241AA|nr:cytochrome P450 [Nocardia noduli]